MFSVESRAKVVADIMFLIHPWIGGSVTLFLMRGKSKPTREPGCSM